MRPERDAVRVWLVDPISYSGMAYADLGQASALRELDTDVTIVGSDAAMLAADDVPRLELFRGTHGRASRLRRGWRYLTSLVRLWDRVRVSRPDIVHWQYTELPVADLGAMIAIRLLGVAQVYTAHELLPWTARRRHRWIFGAVYRVVDATIVHDEARRTALVQRFAIDGRRVHVAGHGGYASFTAPGLAQAEARIRLGLAAEAAIALFFGTIRPSKGLDVLLEAWPLVAREVPNATLLVVGKPPTGLDTARVEASIRLLGSDGRVHHRFEQVSPTVANDCYRASDVVVLPYHDIGTSGVLRYAYDSGRAVVATAVGEHPDHVVEGETGFLVPPRDAAALSEALVRALRDRPQLAVMGETAAAYAAREFRWLDTAAALLRLYRELLTAHRR